jgi:glyoxylase I family protein
VFFGARDPDGLGRWYATHLGVDPPPTSYDARPWWQQAGPTILAAIPADSDQFGGPGRSWSMNFRVADLDAMVDQLRAAGLEVEADPEEYPNGRFASVRDPAGNVVQLWEPSEPATQGAG